MSDNPCFEVDFGIARLYAEGGPDDSIEDVSEHFDEKVEMLLDNVENLKRLDHELAQEFAPPTDSNGQAADNTGRSSSTFH